MAFEQQRLHAALGEVVGDRAADDAAADDDDLRACGRSVMLFHLLKRRPSAHRSVIDFGSE